MFRRSGRFGLMLVLLTERLCSLNLSLGRGMSQFMRMLALQNFLQS